MQRHCFDVWRISGMQHVIVVMFGGLLECNVIVVMFGEFLKCNMSLLGCLENCWNATCHCCDVWRFAGMQRHCWDVWRIAGMQRAIFMMFSDMIIFIQTVCAIINTSCQINLSPQRAL